MAGFSWWGRGGVFGRAIGGDGDREVVRTERCLY